MELFRDTNIDFMKYRRYWIIVSFVLRGHRPVHPLRPSTS